MKITRQRLKNIILEEMSLMEGSDTLDIINTGDAETANKSGMGDISEEELEEGLEMVTPENIQLVADVVAQMGINFAPAIIMAALAMPGMKAVEYLKQKAAEDETVEEAETALEEEQEGTLEELITQAIQEELAHLASKNVK
jgi:restriction endonuclease Mrr